VAGERQQNAEAVDWQRVLATENRAAHHRRRQRSPIARHEPLCELVIFTLNYLAAPWRACSSRGPVPGAT